jgi:AGCS family alanine or glycine:cation symporter
MQLKNLLPFIIILCGLYLGSKGAFFFIKRPIRTLKFTFKGDNTKEALKSLALALSGTLGVGNIVGVAAGIATGGPGAVLWLILSALLSSVIKYAEVSLATDKGDENGIIGIIRGSFSHTGRWLAPIYTLLCLCLCFAMGNALQVRAIEESFEAAIGLGGKALVIPLSAALILLTMGGGKRVKVAVGIIIPAATVIYLGLCLTVILPNSYKIPSVIREILCSAFTPRGAVGGLVGSLLSKPVTEGFARGILSNEAGAGTSSLAHATSKKSSAAVGGILGAFEVFFDTVLLCGITAFTILLGREGRFEGFGDLCDIFVCYSGAYSGWIVFLLTCGFAISTVLCWFYYGQVCLRQLFGKSLTVLYFPTFIAVSILGLFLNSEIFIGICDLMLFFMTLIVCATLIKNCDRIKTLSQQANLLS